MISPSEMLCEHPKVWTYTVLPFGCHKYSDCSRFPGVFGFEAVESNPAHYSGDRIVLFTSFAHVLRKTRQLRVPR